MPTTKPQRMFVLSDLHLDDNSAATVLDQVLPESMALAEHWECPIIAVLGDVYHLRYRLSVRLQNALADLIAGSRFEWAFLPGNHDQVDVAGRNALELLGRMPNVRVFSEPTTWNGVDWMPYRHNLTDFQAGVMRLCEHSKSKTLAIHVGIRGALMNNHLADEDGIDNNFFGQWPYQLVMSGHYHKPQRMPPPTGNEQCNVLYLGSPYQTRADEATQLKYVYVHEYAKLTAIPVMWGKRYHRFVASSLASLRDELKIVDAKDDVRVTCAQGVDLQAAHAVMMEKGLSRFQLTPEPEVYTQRIELKPDGDLKDHAASYAQAMEKPERYGRLMQRFAEITEAAKPVQGGGLL